MPLLYVTARSVNHSHNKIPYCHEIRFWLQLVCFVVQNTFLYLSVFVL